MKIRYAKQRKGNWYYERGIPARLQSALKKKVETIPLGLKSDASNAVITAKIAEIDSETQLYWSSLEQHNQHTLSEIDRISAAKAHLRLHKLKAGDLVNPKDLTESEQREWSNYEDHIVSEVMDSSLGHKLLTDYSEQDHIEELAFNLLKKPQFKERALHRFSNASKLWRKNNKSKSTYNIDRFFRVTGDEEISTESIVSAQKLFVETTLESNPNITTQTLQRYSAEALAALSAYIDEHQLDATAKKYRIKFKSEKQTRYSASTKEQIETYKLALNTSLSPELRLLYLLLCQSSIIQSEALRAKPEDFIANPDGVSYLLIQGATKTESRKRPIPIVVNAKLAQELINETKDAELIFSSLGNLKDPNKIINRPLKEITPSLTAYSFRHGWLDRALNNDIPEEFQSRAGGWSSSNRSAKQGYAKNADVSEDRLKQYEIHQKKINKELLRFIDSESNAVSINRA